jgi:hypothetical protein
MFVKPGIWHDAPAGASSRLLVVHHPNRARLRDEGEDVPESGYWLRRLRDGDVVLATPPAEAAAAEAPAVETDHAASAAYVAPDAHATSERTAP